MNGKNYSFLLWIKKSCNKYRKILTIDILLNFSYLLQKILKLNILFNFVTDFLPCALTIIWH